MLISGVGFLNVPRYPDWPGLDDFTGPKFHTSRWEHHHDLTGKVVAVVGTGSTATQIVPAIQPDVAHLYVFQREPGWVMPKGDRDFTDEERKTFSNPWRRRKERLRLKWLLEKNIWGGRIFRSDTEGERRPHASSASTTSPRASRTGPTCSEAVTPTYPYPGKRPIFASTFYPALKEPNVELVPKAVASVTPTGIVDADGVEREIDVLVMATGFQPANYLARLDDRRPHRHGRCASTGPASRTRSSASPSPSSPTSSSSTARAPTAARSSPCSRASPSTRCAR